MLWIRLASRPKTLYLFSTSRKSSVDERGQADRAGAASIQITAGAVQYVCQAWAKCSLVLACDLSAWRRFAWPCHAKFWMC
ncbi:MAG: hypothetical protein HY287_10460 [Planctomycetes bacterium]|nr:hypothetical protein [Planctomycetota bacterium]MBI3834739.1 hypothetical protein [Planctomycetota bacterium]